MIQVSELKGYKSLRALNAFHSLMLGLKMLPHYMGESYEDFYARIEAMPKDAQVKMIQEAALFVELQKEEVEALIFFCRDSNGIPYQASNIDNLTPDQLHEIIVAVCTKISEIKIDFVSAREKKN